MARRSERVAAALSYEEGYYRSLNSTELDLRSQSSSTQLQRRATLELEASADGSLPQDCYLVDRLVAKRQKNVGDNDSIK